MLINLVPEFLDVIQAADPMAAYHEYLDRHRPVLSSYWHNYVLDLDGPHSEQVIKRTLAADRRDLRDLLGHIDVEAAAQEALITAQSAFEVDQPVDLCLMVGVGAANAGELVVGGRGIAFICLEHFTGRANPESLGMGLDPRLMGLWIAHEVAHTVRYTSPISQSEFPRVLRDQGGYYDYWETGTRLSLREHLINEGLAVLAAQIAAPGRDARDYFGYSQAQYRRLRELEAFLRRAVEPDLDRSGLGLRLRYLSAGMSPSARLVKGKVIPERAGYYLGSRMAQWLAEQDGIARALRAPCEDFRRAEETAQGVQTA